MFLISIPVSATAGCVKDHEVCDKNIEPNSDRDHRHNEITRWFVTRDDVNIKQQHCIKLLFFLGFVLPVRYVHISVNWVNQLNICISRENINTYLILLRIKAHMQRMPKSIQIKNKESNTKPNFQDFVFVYFVHDELMINLYIWQSWNVSSSEHTLSFFNSARNVK